MSRLENDSISELQIPHQSTDERLLLNIGHFRKAGLVQTFLCVVGYRELRKLFNLRFFLLWKSRKFLNLLLQLSNLANFTVDLRLFLVTKSFMSLLVLSESLPFLRELSLLASHIMSLVRFLCTARFHGF